MQSQTSKIIIALIIIAVIIGGGVYWYMSSKTTSEESVETELIAENWQNYQNSNLGFKVRYPGDWVSEEYPNTVYFGPPETKTGGYIWGVFIHEPNELERIISESGDQFNDREEAREDVKVNENIDALLVTVTTGKYPDWIFKTIYFEKDGQLFAIGNGAIDDERFEEFYKSFEFINQ